MSHGHGAAVVGTRGRAARRGPALPRRRACAPVTSSRSPARRTPSRCSAGSSASGRAPVESDPRMSLLGSRAPDALTMCRRYLERAIGRHGGSGRLRVAGRGRLRRRPRRLAGGPALRVGLQPAARRRARCRRSASTTGAGSRRRWSTAPRPPIRSWSAAPTWSASAGFQDPGIYVPVAARCPASRSRTATRSSPSTTPPPWPACGTSSGAVLASLVPDRDQQEDLHLAASEIAANAFRHGVRPVSARVWADGDRVVCVISDRGHLLQRPVHRLRPGARARPVPRRHGPVAGPQALGPRRRAAQPTTGLTVRLSTRLR